MNTSVGDAALFNKWGKRNVIADALNGDDAD
jgi:hypothetical protein